MKDIQQDIDNFLSTPFNRFLVVGLLLLGMGLLFFTPDPPEHYEFTHQGKEYAENETVKIDFFYHPQCPHCKEQMGFNAQLMAEYGNKIKFDYHDTSNPQEQSLMLELYNKHNITRPPGTPTTFLNGEYILGFADSQTTGEELRDIINATLQNKEPPQKEDKKEKQTIEDLKIDLPFELPLIGKTVQPAEYSLFALAVILGLIDGFNPCAMWVLVYLITIVMQLKDRSKLWLLVGSFVFASGVLYFLFMTAWLNAFLFVGYFRPITILVGLVALGGGILSLKDFAKNPQGTLECKVTDSEERKKTMNSINNLIQAPLTWATFLGILILAFSVNSIEFVCSAAIPAVFTQVLALSTLSGLEYYLYILLYVLFFMLDDLIIFGLAAMAISSDIGQKYAGYTHVLGGLIMLGLGIMLLFFPQSLA